MIGRVVTVGAAVLALNVAGLGTVLAGDPDSGPLQLGLEDGVLTWVDVEGEAAYQLSGSAVYLRPQPCLPSPSPSSERIVIEQELLADTTTFALPPASNAALTLLKDVTVAIEALDADGERIAQDGFARQGDPFCTPEEIAAELAAAGGGPPGAVPLWWLPAALAGLGALAVAGGLALRKAA